MSRWIIVIIGIGILFYLVLLNHKKNVQKLRKRNRRSFGDNYLKKKHKK